MHTTFSEELDSTQSQFRIAKESCTTLTVISNHIAYVIKDSQPYRSKSRGVELLSLVNEYLKEAIRFLESNNFAEAICSLIKSEQYNHSLDSFIKNSNNSVLSIGVNSLSSESKAEISFVIASCELLRNNVTNAYSKFMTIRNSGINHSRLNDRIRRCKTLIEEAANKVIENIHLENIHIDADLIYIKQNAEVTKVLYDNIKVTRPYKLNRILEKIEWIEMRDKVTSSYLSLSRRYNSEYDSQEYKNDLNACVVLYEKYPSWLSETDLQQYAELKKLLDKNIIQVNRKNIKVRLTELPSFIQNGDLPKAFDALQSAVASIKIVTAEDHDVQAGTELYDGERSEYYEESLKILAEEVNLFQSRAFYATRSMSEYIINKALKFKGEETIIKTLSSVEQKRLTNIIIKELTAYWHKFDRRDKISHAEFLIVFSKQLSDRLKWAANVKASLLFRDYSLYIDDIEAVKQFLISSLQHYVPSTNPKCINLPIFSDMPPLAYASMDPPSVPMAKIVDAKVQYLN